LRQAVFLVGGLGTRLGDLTGGLPKPLVPVAGRPFIDWLLDKAVAEGFDDLLLLAGHRAEALAPYAQAGQWQGARLRLSIELEPLGTAGALVHAHALLAEDFLLANGDTWFGFDWKGLTLGADYDAVMALRRIRPADRYETIARDGDRVTAIRPRGATLDEGVINGGVYRLRRSVLADLSLPASLETDLLPRLCREGRLAGVERSGDFIDIGVPEAYAAAQTMSFR